MLKHEFHAGPQLAARHPSPWPLAAPFDFDLRHVDRERRASAWLEWNTRVFGAGIRPVNSPVGTLDGYVRGAPLAAGQFYRMRPAFRRVLRQLAPGGVCASDTFTVILQLSGSAVVCSAGRTMRCGPEDVRFHCGDDFEEDMSQDCELLLLRLPMGLVDAQQPGARSLPGQRLGAADPATRLIRSALLSAYDAGPALTPAQQSCLLMSLIGLLGVLRIEAGPCGPDRVRRRIQDALRYVDQHLFDSSFGALDLAGRLHISRRRLDELFVGALGKPVAPYIWERRLHFAGAVLRDPAQHHRSITDIALSHGFDDVAHFARAFKRRFSVTARDWRAGSGREA